MWPIITGEGLTALRRNDDLMFEIQAALGLALVLLMFTGFFTLLAGLLIAFTPMVNGYLLAQMFVGVWFGVSYAVVTRWRVEWSREHVVPDYPGESPMEISLRRLFQWWDRQRKRQEAAVVAGDVSWLGRWRITWRG